MSRRLRRRRSEVSEQEIPRGAKRRRDGFTMEAWWADRSLPQKILYGIGFGVLGVGFIAALGWIVLLLWNWLIPEIFGLRRLNYWQAWGLLVLCWILFKGVRLGSDTSNRSADRRRRRELRSYMKEDSASPGDSAAGTEARS
jgi:hypothetical protein